MTYRRTSRKIGNPYSSYHARPEVLIGEDFNGHPVVIVSGGQRRRAEGLDFNYLGDLVELRADLDRAISEWPR